MIKSKKLLKAFGRYAPDNLNVDISKLTDDEKFQNLSDKMTALYSVIKEYHEKIHNLSNLFKINKLGDEINREYKIIFNSKLEEIEGDEYSEKILSDFKDNYGLDIEELVECTKRVMDEIDSRLLRDKPAYCEVDLLGMTDKKEPVEC